MNTSNFTISKDSLEKTYGVTFVKDERIQLVTKPNFNAAALNESKSIFTDLLISASVLLALVLMGKYISPVIELKHATFLFCFGLIVSIFKFAKHLIKAKKTQFVITNFSIIIYESGTDSKVNCIQLSAIQTVELTKTFFDKKFDTGSLKVFTGQIEKKIGKNEKVYDVINSISEPEKAYSLLRHAINFR